MTLVKMNNGFGKSFDGMMKDFLSEFPSTVTKTFREDLLNFPPVNIIEKAENYLVELSVPGFEKSDFAVKLDGNLLTISTEKKDEATNQTDKMIRKEFTYKSFKRSFTLDEKIDAENISAKYENGILKLELPKKQVAQANAKDISIQ
jgi:HSP20 family protein